MKHITIILAFLIAFGSQGNATEFIISKNVSAQDLRSIKSVYVSLNDFATGGCWTNLREIREYAEEKLRTKGIKTTDDGTVMDAADKKYYLSITVTAGPVFKDASGGCHGVVNINLEGWIIINGLKHLANLGDRTSIFVGPANGNAAILNIVGGVFEVWPK